MEYPDRFEGPKIGDTVYYAKYRNDRYTVEEVVITDIDDPYDWQERGPEELREHFVLFYWIKDVGHGLTFGDDLFLTKEEAEEFIN